MRVNDEANLDLRGEVAKIRIDMREMKFAPLQRERFIFLMGRRHNAKQPHDVKIVVKQYKTYSENYVRAFEILKQIYWEALRAPETDVTSQRNPYRRETLKKKFFGKTKAERDANLKTCAGEGMGRLHASWIEHKANVEIAEQEKAQKGEKDGRSLRAKRRDQSAARAKLGFVEPEAEHENIEDPIVDKLAIDDARFQKKIRESKMRKSVKQITDINGISKEEQREAMLYQNEKFTEVK